MTGNGQVSPCLATQHQYTSREVPELRKRLERPQRTGTFVARTVRITPLCACLANPHQTASPFGTVARRPQLVPVGLAKRGADPHAYRQSKVNNSWLTNVGNATLPATRGLYRCRPPCPARTVPVHSAGVPRLPDLCQKTGDRLMIHLDCFAEVNISARPATLQANCMRPGARRLERPANACAGPHRSSSDWPCNGVATDSRW